MEQNLEPQTARIIQSEQQRQEQCINLIASENFVSKAVLQATGSVLTNKYSEGYPGKRYYAGNVHIDEIEQLAIERAKELFGAQHANVQPYSGSPANFEIYFALLEFGDTILAMDLAQGGHLTHGSRVNFSGKAYNFVHYGLDKETETIDYAQMRALAKEHKPKLIVCGASAYPRIIDFQKIKEIADEVGALTLADVSHIAGLIVAGAHPSPFPHMDVVMTTTHKTLRGPRGAMILCKEQFAKKIDKSVFPGSQGGPHDHTTAGKAQAFWEALQPEFKEYAKQIIANAKALGEALREEGFRLVSGGTDNHLLLVDLTSKNISGKPAQLALEKAYIIANMNMIPNDPRSPMDPSGIRLGSAAMTTRGMKEPQMRQIAKWIGRVIDNHEDEQELAAVKKEVIGLTAQFPLYKER